ncbi:hypothetical protein AO287_27030 [Pseudomonas savastanoi]|uniref:Uncharacterized protein n=3 Tax=Pseudomonas syringae group TaxID=136849 RepID=A0A7Z6U6T6_PSESF|nr:hypothetical protein AO287_27030 [Pseudomonas savastanoi]RMP79863.1 hypothetical protein ALQ15_01392 [Pseudomonas syringae pv. actinidiae]
MVVPLPISISTPLRPHNEITDIHPIWLLACINQRLQDEIHLRFKSGKAIAKRWIDGLGGIAGSITWGVVMLNFINTALTYRDLTQDGDFSAKDIGKVRYELGYSFNLLMAVFVEAPWSLIRDAAPVLIDDHLKEPDQQKAGYLFQLELNSKGRTAADALNTIELEVKLTSRIDTLTILVAE